MSKADRRKRAGRKMKPDVKREPNGQAARSVTSERMEKLVEESRARKSSITGRDDLPVDVLGILRGHDQIGDPEYSIGRKFERLMARIYNSPTESPSAMFRECVSAPNAEDAISVQAMSDDAVEALFRRMNQTLLDCGLAIRDLVVSAVRYNRYPRTMAEVKAIVLGLEVLAKGHAPKAKGGSSMRKAA